MTEPQRLPTTWTVLTAGGKFLLSEKDGPGFQEEWAAAMEQLPVDGSIVGKIQLLRATDLHGSPVSFNPIYIVAVFPVTHEVMMRGRDWGRWVDGIWNADSPEPWQEGG